MCSFLFTTLTIINLDFINFFLKFRGPDFTNVYKQNYKNLLFTFVHNLLNITGEVTYQPYFGKSSDNTLDNDIICVYNGEIYNYKDFGDFKTDGCCIIDVYKKYGMNFVNKLDGEFALILIDLSKELIIISSDVFASKPIWYSTENGNIGVSTYKSGLERLEFKNIIKLQANKTLLFNFDFIKINEQEVFTFDLKQIKDNYDDCINAFDQSIIKRAKNMKYPIFVCLSSGYDSGAICASLLKNNILFSTYTIIADENIDIINKRLVRNNVTHEFINLTKQQFNDQLNYIKQNSEESIYKKYPSNSKLSVLNGNKMTDDPAASGVSYIFKMASSRNQRIYLSGQGADEICSDYGFNGHKIIDHSGFGGLYPSDLNDIFPKNSEEISGQESKWYSFYEGTQKCYLSKEEHISGLYGIEGRYPFLDKNFVQEFLWLKPELKNKKYKSIIDEYMRRENYPFDEGKKIGFNAAKNLL
jgi:asparagine synthetase B (glutamine-hydrolysing)